MSKELDAPKMPTGTYPELSPNPNSEGLKLKDGGRGTPVVVNTEPRQANTNTITVNEVKRLIREGIDHFEKEEGGVTEKEMEEALADKVKYISVSNITALTDAQIDSLKVGDVVQKITGDMKHCYTVTYKQEHHGICLSYFAAGYTETVSYDYTDSHWVYNSTDIVPIANVEGAPSGTIINALGLNLQGKVVKQAQTALYMHQITLKFTSIPSCVLTIYSGLSFSYNMSGLNSYVDAMADKKIDQIMRVELSEGMVYQRIYLRGNDLYVDTSIGASQVTAIESDEVSRIF